MADIAISALPAGAGNMLSTDRIAVDKFNGGPYITVYRTGQEIMDSITSLATATFTNINASINAVSASIVTTANTNYRVFSVLQQSLSISDGVSGFLTFTSINSGMGSNVPYIINFKIYAYNPGVTVATRIKEYNITYVNKATPEIIGTELLYEHTDTVGGTSITIGTPVVHSTNNIRTVVSHTIAGEFVSYAIVATINKAF